MSLSAVINKFYFWCGLISRFATEIRDNFHLTQESIQKYKENCNHKSSSLSFYYLNKIKLNKASIIAIIKNAKKIIFTSYSQVALIIPIPPQPSQHNPAQVASSPNTKLF